MREMKDSGIEWIGEIPREWTNEHLRYLILSRDGGAWGREVDDNDNGIICLRIADFDYDKGVFKNTELENLTYRKYSAAQIKRLRLNKGDILIEKSGGGEKTPVGRSVLFDKEYLALFANFMDRLRVQKSKIMPEFLEYWLRAWYACKSSPYYISQTTGIQNINLTMMLAKETVFFPPLIEQQSIAAFLDAKCAEIDALTEDIRSQIDTLEQYKRSVITEAVTKGLNPDVEMKDSGIEWVGNIPTTWETKPIRALFSEVNEKNRSGSVKTALKFTYGSIVRKKNFDADDDDYVANTILNYTVVQPGTIILNGLNLNFDFVSQRIGLVTETGAITSAYMAFEAIDKNCLSAEYFTYLFKCYDNCKAFHNMGGGVRKILNFSEFKKYYVFVPPLTEQQSIAAFLDAKCAEIDGIIGRKREQLDVLEDYKKSLIFEYVTGKKEVPVA